MIQPVIPFYLFILELAIYPLIKNHKPLREPSQVEEAKPQPKDWSERVTQSLLDEQPIKVIFCDNSVLHSSKRQKIAFFRLN